MNERVMRLWATEGGPVLERSNHRIDLDIGFDEIFRHPDPVALLADADGPSVTAPETGSWRAPIESQEIWASGVTYFASREARIEESDSTRDVYQQVYDAERPELFFKSTAARAAGPGQAIRIRRDSAWNVPEPELTLAVSSSGEVFGYTIGNDVSSRDIEGENPLYLPQAKTYDRSAAIGPCLLVPGEPLPPSTSIELTIDRAGATVFAGTTTLAQLKRSPTELVDHLYRETSFPDGCYLMTGTGIVPPPDFTLHVGDRVSITIDEIGTLANTVETHG